MGSTLILLLFSLFFFLANAQFLPTWGTGMGTGLSTGMTSSGVSTGVSTTSTNQMHVPTYGHVGHMGHWSGFRDAGTEFVPYHAMKTTDGILPIPVIRARLPAKMSLQDYALYNANAPEAEDAVEHLIYKQMMGDARRPVMGIISIIPGPAATATKTGTGYQDPLMDELMTCVGMESADSMKGLPGDSRIVINRPIPYYIRSLHNMKA